MPLSEIYSASMNVVVHSKNNADVRISDTWSIFASLPQEIRWLAKCLKDWGCTWMLV